MVLKLIIRSAHSYSKMVGELIDNYGNCMLKMHNFANGEFIVDAKYKDAMYAINGATFKNRNACAVFKVINSGVLKDAVLLIKEGTAGGCISLYHSSGFKINEWNYNEAQDWSE